jgi:hypothetical protein
MNNSTPFVAHTDLVFEIKTVCFKNLQKLFKWLNFHVSSCSEVLSFIQLRLWILLLKEELFSRQNLRVRMNELGAVLTEHKLQVSK